MSPCVETVPQLCERCALGLPEVCVIGVREWPIGCWS